MKVRSTLLVLVMAGTCFTLLTGCDPQNTAEVVGRLFLQFDLAPRLQDLRGVYAVHAHVCSPGSSSQLWYHSLSRILLQN